MVNDSASSTFNILFAFVAGGLTGACVALLFAPQSGKETRDLIDERFRDEVERGREIKEHVTTKGRDAVEEAAGYLDKQKKELQYQKDRVVLAVEAGRDAYRDDQPKM